MHSVKCNNDSNNDNNDKNHINNSNNNSGFVFLFFIFNFAIFGGVFIIIIIPEKNASRSDRKKYLTQVVGCSS